MLEGRKEKNFRLFYFYNIKAGVKRSGTMEENQERALNYYDAQNHFSPLISQVVY